MTACAYCGRENEDDASSCRECGSKLAAVAAREKLPPNEQQPSAAVPTSSRTRMSARDIFGLIIRVAGLWGLSYGLHHLVSWLYSLRHRKWTGTDRWTSGDYFLACALYLGVGLYLLRGAPLVVSFAYPTEQDQKTRDDIA